MFFNKKLFAVILTITNLFASSWAMETTNNTPSSNTACNNLPHVNVLIINEHNSSNAVLNQKKTVITDFLNGAIKKAHNQKFYIITQAETLATLIVDCYTKKTAKKLLSTLSEEWLLQKIIGSPYVILSPDKNPLSSLSEDTIEFGSDSYKKTTTILDFLMDLNSSTKKTLTDIITQILIDHTATIWLAGHGTYQTPENKPTIAELEQPEITKLFNTCEKSHRVKCFLILSCFAKDNIDLIPQITIPLVIIGLDSTVVTALTNGIWQDKDSIFDEITNNPKKINSYFAAFLKNVHNNYGCPWYMLPYQSNVPQLLLPDKKMPSLPDVCLTIDPTQKVPKRIPPCIVVYTSQTIFQKLKFNVYSKQYLKEKIDPSLDLEPNTQLNEKFAWLESIMPVLPTIIPHVKNNTTLYFEHIETKPLIGVITTLANLFLFNFATLGPNRKILIKHSLGLNDLYNVITPPISEVLKIKKATFLKKFLELGQKTDSLEHIKLSMVIIERDVTQKNINYSTTFMFMNNTWCITSKTESNETYATIEHVNDNEKHQNNFCKQEKLVLSIEN